MILIGIREVNLLNFVDLIELDSKFKRKLEKFFNINLENCKYIGGNSTGDFSICYIFSYEKENTLFENF